jgi:hypothetical protein
MQAKTSPLFEIALVLVRFDHVANVIGNADHSVMRAAEKLRVLDCRARISTSSRFVEGRAHRPSR